MDECLNNGCKQLKGIISILSLKKKKNILLQKCTALKKNLKYLAPMSLSEKFGIYFERHGSKSKEDTSM